MQVFRNGAAKQGEPKAHLSRGEARGRKRSSLRTNPFLTSLFTQDMTIKGVNKPALAQSLVSMWNWVTPYSDKQNPLDTAELLATHSGAFPSCGSFLFLPLMTFSTSVLTLCCAGLLAHACNPSYSEGSDQEDPGLKSALVSSSRVPISKNLSHKKGACVGGAIGW
jgi:hypothetical protein